MTISTREQAILVDPNDCVIGYRYRDELAAGDRFRMVGVWLENHTGQALIAQRSRHKKHLPGLWGAAAIGGVAKGESYEDSAYKELGEEIGLSSITLRHADKELIVNTVDDVEMFCQWFTGHIETDTYEPFTLCEEEVAQICWVDKQELLQDVIARPNRYTPSCQSWPKFFAGNNLLR